MISNNFWKGLSETGLEELVALFQLCWETRTSPHQWKIVQAIGTSALLQPVCWRKPSFGTQTLRFSGC